MADEKESKDCSPLISVKEFKDMIYRQLSVRDLERDRHDATYKELAEGMGISMELVGELDEVCRLKTTNFVDSLKTLKLKN